MGKIVGIDLGTTNSLIASVDSGIPFVIADDEGRRLTPSVVHYPGGGQDPVVGQAARRIQLLKPRQTVSSVKRFMGRRGNEIDREEMVVTYDVKGEGAGPVAIQMEECRLTPEDVSSAILQRLKAIAERALETEVSGAVITVPAYFNDAQRNATKRAGELAGFQVERIVNEPTAAALAYGLNRLGEKSKIAVYDFGGGTFDLSVLELNQGVFQVLATHGNTRLGGDDLDRRLVDFLVGRIRDEAGIDCAADVGLLSRVREAAEAAKIRLSEEESTEITLPFLAPDFSFQCTLPRKELEELVEDIVGRTESHCRQAMKDAGVEPGDLAQVILVGGQTRMPLVRRKAGAIFRCSEFEETRGDVRLGGDDHDRSGPILNTSQNPDEVVALGAAVQAEILAGGFKDLLLLDVTPLSLGIETFGGLMNVIIPRNSTIPVKAGEMFTTAMDWQTSMLIHVLQGEREKAKDNWSLGRFTIEFERAPKGAARVGVQFEIDANGILHVLARDTHTGKEKLVEMKSAVDVDDSDVQQMVEESVEHAFDDLRARQWIEAGVRARETLSATRKGLESCAGELTDEAVAEMRAAVAEVEQVLGNADPHSGTGDTSRLKESTRRLDQATLPLADLLMEKAMDEMLKKRGVIS